VAERCQRLIAEQALEHKLSPHGQRVTLSIGMGALIPDGAAQHSDLLQAVDRQRYVAKQQGRNRIEGG
jgi:PleD family two-component response regulator